ncbi:VanZ family protein [Allorhizocola rhizosphaerae]|uniref:VanZ family protein n=1 Tax=Allorhizocola rhizosphaerae TaxID=1872709 RepID=UPI000E3D662A|nr:VanZ family protein [Allorhizocola rhizosphaerae]
MQRFVVPWVVTLALLPVAGLAIVLLRQWRPSRSWRRSVAEVGMVLGTLPWVWMILLPVRVPPGTKLAHWIPLSDAIEQIRDGHTVIQVGGNLGPLFALGFFASLRWPFLKWWHVLLIGAGCSLLLEVLQRVFVAGRVFSVDDILLNALGSGLGRLVLRLIPLRAPGPTR